MMRVPWPMAVELPDVTAEAAGLGAAVLVGGWLVGQIVAWMVMRILAARGRSPSASRIFGSLTRFVVVLLSFVAAITVVFPSIQPVNALGGIGVLSIAAGIAFQTVLGNMFAGIVIVARDAFRVGDQIAVGDTAGTVTRITLTSTVVRTFDGQLVLIPNAIVHSTTVTVQTGYESVRSTVSINLDDSADLDEAVRVAEAAMQRARDVLPDPAPQALLQEVGTATVRMDLRFWSGARQMETRVARHEVIRAVLADFAQAGVATGSDVVVVEAGPRTLAVVRPDA